MRQGNATDTAGDGAPTVTLGGQRVKLRGGRLCLDFVNTVENWQAPRRAENDTPVGDYLTAYDDLVDWALQMGAIGERAARHLRAAAAARPEAAAAVLHRAQRFRSALYDVVAAAAAGQPATESTLATLNQELDTLLTGSHLEPDGQGYVLARPGERDEESPELERVLWPVLRSALALLTSPEELARVRVCPGDGCGWVFYDASGRRRWCSMSSCGTLHKVRRFRQRRRVESA